MAIEGNDARRVIAEIECEHARVGGVDEPEPDALPTTYCEGLGNAAVYGDGIAQTARVALVVEIAKTGRDRCVPGQAPVVEHPGEITIDQRCVRFLDEISSLAARSGEKATGSRARIRLVHSLLNHNDFITIR